MLKIFIAEDETNTLNFISNIIKNYTPNTELIGSSKTVKKAVSFLNSNEINLALFDINFPDGTSFDILKQLKSYNFSIIFITAHEKHAIRAIKFSAADFLLKPLNPKELIAAIQKIQDKKKEKSQNKLMIESLISGFESPAKSYKKIILKTAERIQVVEIKDIMRCESDGSYTIFFITENRKIIVSKSLKEYDEILCDFEFIRTHKSHLVNLNYITSYEKSDGGYIKMKDNKKIPVSVRKRDFVLNALENI